MKDLKNNAVYYSLVSMVGLIFLSLLLSYINTHCKNTIYMDEIRLIATVGEKIINGEMRLVDYFTVHSGHFSIGTYLLLAFDIKVLKLNTLLFTKLIPLFLAIILFILSMGRLKTESNKAKGLMFDIVFMVVAAFLLFSLYQWEIIWFSYGSIIFLSNVFFILSFLLLCLSFNKEEYKSYILGSSIIGILTALLFGSGYDYAFLGTMLIINVMGIISNYKDNKTKALWYFISLCLNFILLAFLAIILLTGSKSDVTATGTLLDLIKFYIVSISSLFLSNEIQYSMLLRYSIGIVFIIIMLVAVYIYFVKGYYKKSLLPLCLILFSQMVFGSVAITRFSFGLDYGMASRYYTTYIYSLIAVIDILFYYCYCESKKIYKFITLVIIGFICFVSYHGQTQFYDNEKVKVYYRKELAETMISTSLFYDAIDITDEDLMALYQNDSEYIIKCFNFFKKYKLYTYSDNSEIYNKLTEDILSAKYKCGYYDTDVNSRFIEKKSVVLLLIESNTKKTLSFYNPPNFKDNKITIFINDVCVYDNISISSGELIELHLDLKQGVNEIRIELEFDTNPSTNGIGDDIRDLGLMFVEG